jgi:hypothetical protein
MGGKTDVLVAAPPRTNLDPANSTCAEDPGKPGIRHAEVVSSETPGETCLGEGGPHGTGGSVYCGGYSATGLTGSPAKPKGD